MSLIFLLCHVLEQGWGTLVLEGHFLAECNSNPNQTQLSKLINIFRITKATLR